MQDFKRVSKLQPGETPFQPSTYYKWHSLGKYQEIFKKFGGSLLIDVKALETLIRGGQETRTRGEEDAD